MKKPFLYALGAALYIILIVSIINLTGIIFQKEATEDTIIAPMVMLSLFVLSAAVMGYLFLSEPLQLLIAGQKREAITFFAKVVGYFACCVVVLAIVLFFSL
jgi:hypothetical protein